jgi:hypothetical protein
MRASRRLKRTPVRADPGSHGTHLRIRPSNPDPPRSPRGWTSSPRKSSKPWKPPTPTSASRWTRPSHPPTQTGRTRRPTRRPRRTVELVDERETLTLLLEQLSEPDRTIVVLRFFGDQTQSQIAQRVGLPDACLSRLLAGHPGRSSPPRVVAGSGFMRRKLTPSRAVDRGLEPRRAHPHRTPSQGQRRAQLLGTNRSRPYSLARRAPGESA